MSDLESRAIEASRWSFYGELASKIATPVMFLALARLLSPEEFGVVAAATAIVTFSQVFWDAGLSKALVQWRGTFEQAANTVFWANVALCFLLYGLILVVAAPVAALIGDPAVTSILRVQGLQLVIGALSATHLALFQRELDFRSLFWIRMPAALAPGLIAIPLALLGWGAWALVAGSLTGAALQAAVLWARHPWRPRFELDFVVVKPLLRYGSWVAGEGVLAWFFTWADALIVGAFLGAHALGLYRTGNTFVTMAYGLLFAPLLPVLFGYFSRIDRARVSSALTQVVRVIALFALPLAILAGFVGAAGGALLFGAQWHGIGTVVAVMGVTHGIGWLVGAHGEAYRAVGRPDINTKIMSVSVAICLPAFLAGAALGLEAFLVVRLLCTLIGVAIHALVAQRALGVSAVKVAVGLRSVAIGAVLMIAMMAVVVLAFSSAVADDMIRVTTLVVVGVAAYAASIYALDRAFLAHLAVTFNRSPARGS